MLHLVLGGKNSGKTHFIYNSIKARADEGGSAVLLVPEQFSFESEKQMLELLGERKASLVEVTGFSRLAENLVSQRGGIMINEAGRAALMSLAVDACRDGLKAYGSSKLKSTDLVEEMLGMALELRQCSVEPETLLAIAPKTSDRRLRNKLTDLGNILSLYKALVAERFDDDLDLPELLARAVGEQRYFEGKAVYIDGFTGFTQQEYNVISQIMTQSEDVYVALCTDSLSILTDEDGEPADFDRFVFIKKTAEKLRRIASDNFVKVKAVTPEENPRRYSSPALAHLENYLYSDASVPFDGEPDDSVTVYNAADAEDECAFVAMTVRSLISSGRCRCRDIAVVSRSEGSYSKALRVALKKHGVPVFDDRRQPLLRQPLSVLIRAALEIAAYGVSTERIFAMLKTGIAGLDTEQTSLLEDYTYVWQIDGDEWLRRWERSPFGFDAGRAELAAERLALIDSLRESVMKPLTEFLDDIVSSADGAGAVGAVYSFLVRINAAENLKKFALALVDSGDPAGAEEADAVWRQVCEVLDRLYVAFKNERITNERLLEIFVIVINGQSVGLIPGGLDEIVIGAADRVRLSSPKVVFAVGMNEGSFPLSPAQGKILLDSDRRELRTLGLNINEPSQAKFFEERFLVYNTLCAASGRLYVTACRRDFRGGAAASSEVIDELRRLFPSLNETSRDSLGFEFLTQSDPAVFEYAASHFDAEDEDSAAARLYLEGNAVYRDRLRALARARGRNSEFSVSSETAHGLYGDRLNLSATRIDSFSRCGFSFFCRYGLKLNEKRIAEADSRVIGTVVHFVLEKLVSLYGKKLTEMSDKEIREIVFSVMREYSDANLESFDFAGSRARYLFDNLAETVCGTVLKMIYELRTGEFVPAAYELQIGGEGSEIPAVRLSFPGGSLALRGTADRVDLYRDGSKTYLRIIDYKTGRKTFKLCDVLNGLNMQMLLYLFAVCEGGEKRFGKVIPAGVLYMPLSGTGGSLARTDPELMREAAITDGKLSGLLIKNARVVAACDRGYRFDPESEGDPYPKYNGKLFPSDINTMLIPPEKLGLLEKFVREKLRQTVDAQAGGEVRAVPVRGGSYDRLPCEYCQWAAVCLREDDWPEISYPNDRLEKCLEIIEAGEGGGGNG